MSDMVLVQDNTSVDMDLEEGELSHDDDQDLNNDGHILTDESKFPENIPILFGTRDLDLRRNDVDLRRPVLRPILDSSRENHRFMRRIDLRPPGFQTFSQPSFQQQLPPSMDMSLSFNPVQFGFHESSSHAMYPQYPYQQPYQQSYAFPSNGLFSSNQSFHPFNSQFSAFSSMQPVNQSMNPFNISTPSTFLSPVQGTSDASLFMPIEKHPFIDLVSSPLEKQEEEEEVISVKSSDVLDMKATLNEEASPVSSYDPEVDGIPIDSPEVLEKEEDEVSVSELLDDALKTARKTKEKDTSKDLKLNSMGRFSHESNLMQKRSSSSDKKSKFEARTQERSSRDQVRLSARSSSDSRPSSRRSVVSQSRERRESGKSREEDPMELLKVKDNARNRRKVKRMMARKVQTFSSREEAEAAVNSNGGWKLVSGPKSEAKKSSRNSFPRKSYSSGRRPSSRSDKATSDSPSSPDQIVVEDLKDASIEELMSCVEKIRGQLLDLAKESKEAKETITNDDVGEKEAKFEEEDDDLGALRQIAILSMKRMAMEEEGKAAQSPQENSLSKTPVSDEEDEEKMRQNLLKSMMLKKTLTKSQAIVSSDKPSSSSFKPSTSSPLVFTQSNVSTEKSNSVTFVTTTNKFNRTVNQTNGRLIIQINTEDDNTSSDEDDNKEPPGLSALLFNARNAVSKLDMPGCIEKLPLDRQEEYLLLTQEIERRKKDVEGKKPLLDQKEKKFFDLKESISNKKKLLNDVSVSLGSKKTQCLKARDHANKMKELYEAAVRVANQTAIEFNDMNNQLTRTKIEIQLEMTASTELENECIRLGKAVQGTSYVKPSNKYILDQQKKLKETQKKLLEFAKKRNERRPMSISRSTLLKKTPLSGRHFKNIFQKRMPVYSTSKNVQLQAKDKDKLPEKKSRKESEGSTKQDKSQTVNDKSKTRDNLRRKKDMADEKLQRSRQDSKRFAYQSSMLLNSLPSLRMNAKFEDILSHDNNDPMSDFYSNSVDPLKVVCYHDLHGFCRDTKCRFQHKSSYLMTNRDKLVDILSYNPLVAQVTADDVENDPKAAKEALYSFVDRFIKSLPQATFKEYFHQLLVLVRDSLKDVGLLSIRRQISMLKDEDKKRDMKRERDDQEEQSKTKRTKFLYSFNGESDAEDI